jgi:hypothetical protein
MFKVKDAQGGFKYAGRSRAKVTDNRDPLNRGRIQVDHPILGTTVWIDYLRTPHMVDIPSIGDVVYVETDSGVYEFPIAWGNLTKGNDANVQLPVVFKRDIPTNRGMYTPGGHLFEMDDGIATNTGAPNDTNYTTNKRGIRVTSRAGNKIHIVEDTVNSNQYILLQDAGGNIIKLDYKNNQLTVHSIGKTNISTVSDKTETVGGKEQTNISSDKTETIGGKLTINVTGNCEVTAGGNVIVTAPQIQLNGQTSGITTENSHQSVIDFITGVPVMPSTTVFSDI